MPITIRDIQFFEDSFEDLPGGKHEFMGDGERLCFDLLGDGRHWYIVMTPSSLDITVPDENKPLMQETRQVVDMIQRAVTWMMSDYQSRKALREEPEHE
jgi:hypothetical protein